MWLARAATLSLLFAGLPSPTNTLAAQKFSDLKADASAPAPVVSATVVEGTELRRGPVRPVLLSGAAPGTYEQVRASPVLRAVSSLPSENLRSEGERNQQEAVEGTPAVIAIPGVMNATLRVRSATIQGRNASIRMLVGRCIVDTSLRAVRVVEAMPNGSVCGGLAGSETPDTIDVPLGVRIGVAVTDTLVEVDSVGNTTKRERGITVQVLISPAEGVGSVYLIKGRMRTSRTTALTVEEGWTSFEYILRKGENLLVDTQPSENGTPGEAIWIVLPDA